jgi:L-alanine-DL-glutamate epimerase-like enolase superfamily enzyme
VMEPFEIVKNGHLELPDGPGLGARVDPVAIAMRGKQWTE